MTGWDRFWLIGMIVVAVFNFAVGNWSIGVLMACCIVWDFTATYWRSEALKWRDLYEVEKARANLHVNSNRTDFHIHAPDADALAKAAKRADQLRNMNGFR